MEGLLKWIDIIGLDKSDALSIYQKKVICADHFEDSCSSPGTKRLNANAYPTLNLPSTNIEINKVADLNVSGCEPLEDKFENTHSNCNNLNVSPSVLRLLSKFQFIIQHLAFMII